MEKKRRLSCLLHETRQNFCTWTEHFEQSTDCKSKLKSDIQSRAENQEVTKDKHGTEE